MTSALRPVPAGQGARRSTPMIPDAARAGYPQRQARTTAAANSIPLTSIPVD
jgi:hypothetical protein